MLSVVNNLGAMNAQRQFNITGASIKNSMEKLSSGYRINRAADDAAGLTISEKMRSLIRGMNQGADNIQDGISVMQIADGALAEVHGMLHRMTELSIKAANGTNTAADRAAIQSEINELSSEITRIGKTTTFNTLHILDNGEPELFDDGAITQLVKCGSTDQTFYDGKTYLREAYLAPDDGKYYPAGILDFTSLNKAKIKALDGKGFSFVCGYGCGETFKFTFDESSNETKLINNGNIHNYMVGTKDVRNGSQLADALYRAVEKDPIPGHPGECHGGRRVSHDAGIAKVADGKLAVFQSSAEEGFSNKTSASTRYPKGNNTQGMIDCSEITGMTDAEDWTNEFRIQCSNVVDDCEFIETYRMNARTLGVDSLNVLTEENARACIEKIDKALAKVSEQRSAYGAFQNRLEHSYANNTNKAENMTAAESRIRDTDMAKEMVSLTTSNILSQAGSAMLSQAMQDPQSILQLLS